MVTLLAGVLITPLGAWLVDGTTGVTMSLLISAWLRTRLYSRTSSTGPGKLVVDGVFPSFNEFASLFGGPDGAVLPWTKSRPYTPLASPHRRSPPGNTRYSPLAVQGCHVPHPTQRTAASPTKCSTSVIPTDLIIRLPVYRPGGNCVCRRRRTSTHAE